MNLSNAARASFPTIPPILHQVWLGGSRLPPLASCWRAELQLLHPHWDHRLWTESSLRELSVEHLVAQCQTQASRANVVRLAAIARYGGIYLDCDCEPVRPMDDLLVYESFAAFEEPDHICNAVFGAAPNTAWVNWQMEQLPAYVNQSPPWGPRLMTAAPRERLTILPTDFFYPFLWDAPPEARRPSLKSYVVHHWYLSWQHHF